MAYINKKTVQPKKIEIYQLENESPNWYAKLRLGDAVTKRISLKTTDVDEAKSIAFYKWQELNYKHEKGYSLNSVPFQKVARDYLKDYKHQVDIKMRLSLRDQKKAGKVTANILKSHTEIMNNFIIPILGEMNISDIADDDIKDYIEKRLMWWVTGAGFEQERIPLKNGKSRIKRGKEKGIPNYNTVNRSLSVIRAVFDFAKDNKIISRFDIPEIKNMPKPEDNDIDNLTPSFTSDEMELLNETLIKKVQNQTNPKHYRSNFRFANYVAIMSKTGMRSSDTKNLKIKDCHLEASTPYIYVNSKKSKRQVIPNDNDCWDYITDLIEHHKQNAIDYGWSYSEDINLFSNDKGKPIGSYIGQLTRLLESCDLKYSVDDEGIKKNRNTKSFRTYYVTKALEAGISIDMVARNVGHDPKVTKQYYDRMLTSARAGELQFNDNNFNSYVPVKVPQLKAMGIPNPNSFRNRLKQKADD